MGHHDVVMAASLLLVASITAGNAVFIISTMPTMQDLLPASLHVYLYVMFWMLLPSAALQLGCAVILCKRGMSDFATGEYDSEFRVAPLNTEPLPPSAMAVSVQPVVRCKVPWNRLPLFSDTPHNRLPADVSMERLELPAGGSV